jgi:hypothetical protein
MRIVSNLYRLARTANDVATMASLNPRRIFRHFVVNKFIGRQVARRLYWSGRSRANRI